MAYTKNTNFTAKDNLAAGNPSKIIKGSELDAEFDEIATEDALSVKLAGDQTITGNKTLSGNNTFSGTNEFQKVVNFKKGADVASAAELPILTDGNYFDVTGTTAVTSIATTGKIGTVIKLHFDGALTLTHHATDLILPGGANITTAAGDEAEFVEYASGDFRCTSYTKASGEAVVSTSVDTQQIAKAWVNFDGTGTVSIRDSYNVTSITDNGTGDYTVNFTSDMANANYCVAASGGRSGGGASAAVYTAAVGSVGIRNYSDAGALVDGPQMHVAVFGDT